MAQPDRIDLSIGRPSQGEVSHKAPTLPNTIVYDPNTLAAINCDLRTVAGEAERRQRLLRAVTLDENGVAHCLNEAGLETLLAAVAISDQKTATLLPFEGGDEEIYLPVPANKPTRFGFFVGHRALGDISAAIRMGLYPGLPLITEAVTDARNNEVLLGMKGIKSEETEEQRWAEEIGLFDRLGHSLQTSRGFFSSFHKPNALTDTWRSSPLVATPDGMIDLLRHYDPATLRIDTFQMLMYATRDMMVRPISVNPSSDGILGGYLGERGEHSPDVFISEVETKGLGQTMGMSVGFGEAVSKTGRVTGIGIDYLAGVFQVVVTPR